MVKLKTVGSREHFEKEFRLRESFELCRNMGKNLFVAEGYLIDEEREEGGKKNKSKWDLNTPLAERSPKERNIGVKTKTSSWEGYKVAVACTLSVSFRGEIKLNRLQIIAFQIYRNIGVEDGICGKLLFSREFANRRIHA